MTLADRVLATAVSSGVARLGEAEQRGVFSRLKDVEQSQVLARLAAHGALTEIAEAAALLKGLSPPPQPAGVASAVVEVSMHVEVFPAGDLNSGNVGVVTSATHEPVAWLFDHDEMKTPEPPKDREAFASAAFKIALDIVEGAPRTAAWKDVEILIRDRAAQGWAGLADERERFVRRLAQMEPSSFFTLFFIGVDDGTFARIMTHLFVGEARSPAAVGREAIYQRVASAISNIQAGFVQAFEDEKVAELAGFFAESESEKPEAPAPNSSGREKASLVEEKAKLKAWCDYAQVVVEKFLGWQFEEAVPPA